jgi:hypothetical protein
MDDVSRGKIELDIRIDAPVVVKFTGDITGKDIDVCIRSMMKGYRIWKSEIRKDLDGRPEVVIDGLVESNEVISEDADNVIDGDTNSVTDIKKENGNEEVA